MKNLILILLTSAVLQGCASTSKPVPQMLSDFYKGTAEIASGSSISTYIDCSFFSKQAEGLKTNSNFPDRSFNEEFCRVAALKIGERFTEEPYASAFSTPSLASMSVGGLIEDDTLKGYKQSPEEFEDSIAKDFIVYLLSGENQLSGSLSTSDKELLSYIQKTFTNKFRSLSVKDISRPNNFVGSLVPNWSPSASTDYHQFVVFTGHQPMEPLSESEKRARTAMDATTMIASCVIGVCLDLNTNSADEFGSIVFSQVIVDKAGIVVTAGKYKGAFRAESTFQEVTEELIQRAMRKNAVRASEPTAISRSGSITSET